MSEKGMPRWAKLVALGVLIVFVVWCVLVFVAQRWLAPVGVIV